MTAEDYLKQLLGKITAPTGNLGPGSRVKMGLTPTIQQWAAAQLAELILSGSYAKGTSIVGGTDVDLFISLKSDTGQTLKELYQNLASFMSAKGYTVVRQNVSIGITYSGLKVDLVPGKKQSAFGTDHSIYVSRQDTWQKTNVQTHVQVIGGSGHTDVIRLVKHWRTIHGVEFPSFAAELAVLKALNGHRGPGLAARFYAVLGFLRDRISTVALYDIANTNHNVAAEMTVAEKTAIASAARSSLGQRHWESIVW